MNEKKTLKEVIDQFLTFGFTSFGGPFAHIGLLRNKYVENLKWVDNGTFNELFAICNAVPGNIIINQALHLLK